MDAAPEKDPAPRADAFAAIRLPLVRRFAVGRGASVLGMQIGSMAIGWQLYERTHSAWALGLVGLFLMAPMILCTIPAGSLADRLPRRGVAMLASLGLALTTLGLAIVSWLDAPVPFIYGLLLLFGAARTFAAPAIAGILPQLLPPEQFANVNAWIGAVFHLATISGPAIGGFLIGLRGTATLAFLVGTAGHLLFMVMLATLPSVQPRQSATSRSVKALFAGFRFIRRSPVFLSAMTLDLFAVMLGDVMALLPIFAKDILQVGPVGLGWMRAAPSLGALLTALVATRIAWHRPGRMLLLTVAGYGLATIGFGLSRTLIFALIFLFLTGVFDQVSVVIRITLAQVITPDSLRGRVSALHSVFVGLANDMGRVESGATAAAFGPILSVVGGGIGALIVVALVALGWPKLARLGPLHALGPDDSADSA